MQLMVHALAQSIDKVAGDAGDGALDVVAVARELAKASVTLHGQTGAMRASDHQFQQALVVGLMGKAGTEGIKFDVEGSGYGFRVIKTLSASQASQPTTCALSTTTPMPKSGYN